MNRIRKFAIGAVMLIALGAMAQQTTTTTPSVDDHLKWLSTQLNLSAEQQAKLRPIVQKMQDGMEKIRQDQSLTPEARHEKMQALHTEAVKEAQPYLSSEQQQKLDELAKEPHPMSQSGSH